MKARLALSNTSLSIFMPGGLTNFAFESCPSSESVDIMSSVMSYQDGTLTTMVPLGCREVVGMKLTYSLAPVAPTSLVFVMNDTLSYSMWADWNAVSFRVFGLITVGASSV